jgi:hypothetical protein
MARWVWFTQANDAGILVDVDSVDAVSQDRLADGSPAARLWFGCPKDDPTPEQDIYGSVLVKGDIGKLALMLGAETFTAP